MIAASFLVIWQMTDDDVYYYGIHVGSNGGLLGLGWIGDANDVWSRNAIGVGWTGDTAPETAVHELGHNHGRQHSPCGVSGDANYPHSGASIGVWGYHPAKKQLLDPYDYVDFMSYCDPAWVSDYTYKALFTRLKNINGAKIFVPPHMLDRTYDRVRILDGQLDWLTSRTMPRPPMGQEKAVTVTTLGGTKVITGNFFPYNHLDGGVMFILRPKLFTVVDQLQAVAFDYNGQLVSLGP